MSNDAGLFGFDGFILPAATLAGVVVDVVVRLDHEELARRAEHGLGAVDDRDLLVALGQMPLGWCVPANELDPVVRAFVEGAPQGLVERVGDGLVRLYRPAAHAAGVVTRQRDWRTGIDVVSRFAAVAPRGLVLTGPLRDVDQAVDSAVRFGVGLAVRNAKSGSGRLLVAAATRFRRPGTAEWLFSERVLAEWRRRQVPQAS